MLFFFHFSASISQFGVFWPERGVQSVNRCHQPWAFCCISRQKIKANRSARETLCSSFEKLCAVLVKSVKSKRVSLEIRIAHKSVALSLRVHLARMLTAIVVETVQCPPRGKWIPLFLVYAQSPCSFCIRWEHYKAYNENGVTLGSNSQNRHLWLTFGSMMKTREHSRRVRCAKRSSNHLVSQDKGVEEKPTWAIPQRRDSQHGHWPYCRSSSWAQCGATTHKATRRLAPPPRPPRRLALPVGASLQRSWGPTTASHSLVSKESAYWMLNHRGTL